MTHDQSNVTVNTEEQGMPSPPDVLLIPKQSSSMFITTEFFVYVSQVVMFFFVAILTSNLLRNEKQLLDYMSSKINENTMFEVGATMLAIAATLGIISAISKAAPAFSLLERLADEVLAEAPRTAYVFGSSVSGTLFAAAIYISQHPNVATQPPSFWVLSTLFASLLGFLYGCAFSFAFKHKAYIKATARFRSKAL